MNKWTEFCCDFETENNETDCRVWSFGAYPMTMNDDEYVCGKTLDEFFSWVLSLECKKICLIFHNAKFDFSFFEYKLIDMGIEWVDNNKLKNNQYTSLISDFGVFYSAKFKYNNKEVKILDSAKIIQDKLENFPKLFGFEDIKKGSIDYNKPHPIGYEPTKEEKEYQFNDCKLLAKGWKILRDEGYNKLTLASNTLDFFKQYIGRRCFNLFFPILDSAIDNFCREAYHGGLCVVNPLFKNKKVGKGKVFDVNSLYPFANSQFPLPFGQPKWFDGQYKDNLMYPLFFQKILVDCKLKDGHIPCIILKGGGRYVKNTYLENTNGEMIEKVLTKYDLELLLEHYEIFSIKYCGGYMFKASENIFKSFFENLFKDKEEATKNGNKSKRTLTKMKMNSLGGKFGTNPISRRKKPIYDKVDGIIRYKYIEEIKKTVYVPVIAYVTAIGRYITATAIHDNIERFLYCDTDSIHLLGWQRAKGIEVNPIKIGAWDMEMKFSQAKYIRQKTYIEILYDKNNTKKHGQSVVKCAGLPNADKLTDISVDDFKTGLEVIGLKQKRVKNGVVLYEHPFTLK